MTTQPTALGPRRRFLRHAATGAVATGALAAPMLSTAQTNTSLRFQSTWPSKDIFHEYALDFVLRHRLLAEHEHRRLEKLLLGNGDVR